MGKKLVITKWNHRIVSAVFEQDKMIEVNIDTQDNSIALNDIYVGRVQNIVSNINCAFIEITDREKCYYSLDDNKEHIFLNPKKNDNIHIGDHLLVQVAKEEIKGKLPSLTCKINLPGKFVVLVRNSSVVAVSNKIKDPIRIQELKTLLNPLLNSTEEKYGFVVRTNAEEEDNQKIYEEAVRLTDTYQNLCQNALYRPPFTKLYTASPSYIRDAMNINEKELEEIITDEEVLWKEIHPFHEITLYKDTLLPLYKLYNIEGQIRSALNKRVWLKSGGYLILEPTEALTVIDVNTGKFSGNKKLKENTFMKINLEAAAEIAKQIRLRNYSGIIIVDFINMSQESDRHKLMDYLNQELLKDPVPTLVVDMTRLELVEITRKKIRKPLHEACSEIFTAK